jgi:hypothetical protein
MNPEEGVSIISFRGGFFLRAGNDSLAEVVRETSLFTRLGSPL